MNLWRFTPSPHRGGGRGERSNPRIHPFPHLVRLPLQFQRQRKRESRPRPRGALDPEATAEMVDDLAADRQAEASSLWLGGQGVAALAELLEDRRLLRRADARAVIGNVHARFLIAGAQADGDAAGGAGAGIGGG